MRVFDESEWYLASKDARRVGNRPERNKDPLTCGADPNCIIHIPCWQGGMDIIEELIDADSDIRDETIDRTPLHMAAKVERTGIIEWLLDRGADINAETASGLAPLHVAAQAKKVRAARLLLERGADPFRVNCDNEAGIDRIMKNINDLDGEWQDLIEIIRHKWPDAYLE